MEQIAFDDGAIFGLGGTSSCAPTSCEGREVRADILVQIADLAGIAHAFEVRVASLWMMRRGKSCSAQ